MNETSNCSYLNPREPSILNFIHGRAFKKTNLLPLFEDEDGNLDSTISSLGNINIYLRIKPSTTNASCLPQEGTFDVKDDRTLVTRALKDRMMHKFSFTRIFKENALQEDVFNKSISDLLKQFLYGRNCLLFAYGTSSAGKTYTVQGTPHQPGIIPRAIGVVFNSIKGKESKQNKYKVDMVSRVVELDEKTISQEAAVKKKIMNWYNAKGYESSHSTKSTISNLSVETKYESVNGSTESHDYVSQSFREMQQQMENSIINIEDHNVYSVWVSFAEIYNENVYDLLEPNPSKGQKRQFLPLSQDEKGQVYIRGLRHICVNSGDEAYQVMLYGQHNLKFAPTNLNSLSSRSHSIFTMKLLQHANVENPKFIRISMFSFCDLAGAERAKHTKNSGERLKESQNINTSLLVLGRCLKTIRDNQMNKHKILIPFRDSKLTRLFQRALTGKETVTMIVNISPSLKIWEETFHVLNFSAIAKQIVLETRNPKKFPRTSRFSQYILKHSTLISNANESSLTFASTRLSDELRNQIETLTNQVSKLKQDLAGERKAKLNLESDVRNELCEEFSRMMIQVETNWKNRLENQQAHFEYMTDWRAAKFQAILDNQSRKKRCLEDDELNETEQVEDDEEKISMKLQLDRMNEFLRIKNMELKELTEKNTKLSFDLSKSELAVKDAEKIIEATKAVNNGEKNILIGELESQLKCLKIELEEKNKNIQEFEGIVQDANEDVKALEDELKSTEKERDHLELRLAEIETEMKLKDDALGHTQHMVNQQLFNLNEKDTIVETLEKQLTELKTKYEAKIIEYEELKNVKETNVKENSMLTSEMEELKKQLKVSEDKLQIAEARETTFLAEIKELKNAKVNAEDKLDEMEKAQKDTLKQMIAAKTALTNQEQQQAEHNVSSRNEISKLEMELQVCKQNADLVRSLKDELENKSSRFEELEQENETLKKNVEMKVIEMENFEKNRDDVFKKFEDLLKKEREESERNKREVLRYQQTFLKNTPTPNKTEYEAKIRKLNDEIEKQDFELRDCYVKIKRLEDELFNRSASMMSEACSSTRQNPRKKIDENTHPALISLEKKKQNTRKKTSAVTDGDQKKLVQNDKKKTRRKNLFSAHLDDSTELKPEEIQEVIYSLSPGKILRNRRV